jgi:hypothetical protein
MLEPAGFEMKVRIVRAGASEGCHQHEDRENG